MRVCVPPPVTRGEKRLLPLGVEAAAELPECPFPPMDIKGNRPPANPPTLCMPLKPPPLNPLPPPLNPPPPPPRTKRTCGEFAPPAPNDAAHSGIALKAATVANDTSPRILREMRRDIFPTS
jgi:hypothetical protein